MSNKDDINNSSYRPNEQTLLRRRLAIIPSNCYKNESCVCDNIRESSLSRKCILAFVATISKEPSTSMCKTGTNLYNSIISSKIAAVNIETARRKNSEGTRIKVDESINRRQLHNFYPLPSKVAVATSAMTTTYGSSSSYYEANHDPLRSILSNMSSELILFQDEEVDDDDIVIDDTRQEEDFFSTKHYASTILPNKMKKENRRKRWVEQQQSYRERKDRSPKMYDSIKDNKKVDEKKSSFPNILVEGQHQDDYYEKLKCFGPTNVMKEKNNAKLYDEDTISSSLRKSSNDDDDNHQNYKAQLLWNSKSSKYEKYLLHEEDHYLYNNNVKKSFIIPNE